MDQNWTQYYMILQPVLDQSEVVLKSRVFHVILRLVLDQSQGGPKLVPKSCVFHMILHHTMDHLGKTHIKKNCFFSGRG